ncbi:MAG: alpha/beta hydrolase [Proteobacteria bacterium]|nr:alpha/beta hydrolase [Pseudomonadota bacterium]
MKTPPSICNVNGLSIAYQQEGSGETVLLVHGITTYSFIWRRIVPLLRDRFRVISVDLLGCGGSAKPLDVSYSLPQHCEILRQFIECLGVTPVHFVGHDIGGGIGQLFAVRYPEKLHSLTLINSVGHDFWPVQPIIAIRTPIIRQLAMASLDIGAFRLVVRRGLYHKEMLTEELMDHFWKPMRDRAGRRAFLHFANCLNNQHLVEIEEDLHRIKLPVQIIRGDADLYLSEAIAVKLHNDIPGSILTRIATGGHFIQEDEPESLAEAIGLSLKKQR